MIRSIGFLARSFLLALVAGCAFVPARGVPAPKCRSTDATEARIRFYEDKVREQPRLAPMYTGLGLAYLARAQESHEPAWLEHARAAERQALALQDNFDSLMAMAAIQSYAHRFVDAISWYRRADAASVNAPWISNPAIVAGLVDAHLGLGELEAARQLVGSPDVAPPDYYSAAALGRWLAEAGRTTEAVVAFGAAARFARDQGVAVSAAWAETAAAAALLDANRLEEARPHIETAETIDPCLATVRIHRAELAELEGRWSAALAGYEALLEDSADPVVAARAFTVAQRLGRASRAARHFDTAELGLRSALDAGEVYTLGALARLYADAGKNLDDAIRLAERNLQWKRDREALRTLAIVQARVSEATNPP